METSTYFVHQFIKQRLNGIGGKKSDSEPIIGTRLPYLKAMCRIHELESYLISEIFQMIDSQVWTQQIQAAVDFDISEIESMLVNLTKSKSQKEIIAEVKSLLDDEISRLGYVLQFVRIIH